MAMKQWYDDELKIRNLEVLMERLHNEGRTADSWIIRQVLAILRRRASKK